jgi:uncharacterized protein YjeT (DUF2065 family)
VTGGDAARFALAAVRIVNGTAALVAPRFAAGRLGTSPEATAASVYPLRMFGIRTVVVGAELLVRNRAVRRTALDAALVVHASDTCAAALGGLRRELPRRQAAVLVLVSAANTALALLARRAR